jgi:hypothetical protein
MKNPRVLVVAALGLFLATAGCNEQCPCPNPGPGWCQDHGPNFDPVGCNCPSFSLCPGFCLLDGGSGPVACDAG